MESENLRRVAPLAFVFILSSLFLFAVMTRDILVYDEGLVLLDAMRSRAGELLHRDFYSVYGPASYYILAFLFGLTDYHFIASRLYSVVTMGAIVTASYALLQPRTILPVRIAAAISVTAFLILNDAYLYPVLPCILLALIGSGLIVERDGLTRRPIRLALAGVLTALTALFRYDAGFFLALIHGLTILLLMPRTGADWLRGCIRSVGIYAGGTAILFLPLALAYLSVASPHGFINDIVEYALKYYPRMRALPFPSPLSALHSPWILVIYFPFVVGALGLADLGWQVLRKRPISRVALARDGKFAIQLLLALLTLIFSYKGVLRVSVVQMMIAIIPATVLLAIIVQRWIGAGGRTRLLGYAGLAGGLCFALGASAGTIKDRVLGRATAPLALILGTADTDGDDAKVIEQCNRLPAMKLGRLRPEYTRAAVFLQRHALPDEKIFVGLRRHDIVFVNAPILYVAANRMPMTHWAQFDPGMTNRLDVQQEMVAEFSTSRPRWVVRDGLDEGNAEPNDSVKSSGIRLVDDYLAAHYRPVARSGVVEIWLRRDVPAPAIDAADPCMPEAYDGG